MKRFINDRCLFCNYFELYADICADIHMICLHKENNNNTISSSDESCELFDRADGRPYVLGGTLSQHWKSQFSYHTGKDVVIVGVREED